MHRSPKTIVPSTLLIAIVTALLLTAGTATAAQRSDTVNIDPGSHAAIRVDFTDGPTQDVSYDVDVTEGPNIDILVMNNANYQRYTDGQSFSYEEDWSDLDTGNSVGSFTLQDHGTWWIVLDHTSRPDGGTGPGIVGGESVTASYTLETSVNVREEAEGLADRIPGPAPLVVAVLLVLAAVAGRRSLHA